MAVNVQHGGVVSAHLFANLCVIHWFFITKCQSSPPCCSGVFHSILVMIVATVTYAMAVSRLGAFMAGGLSSLAPFISAIIAVPLLGEPLNMVMVLGLIGMGLGTVQPWRWIKYGKY